ncbi:MAG: hypothetical protein DRP14_03950, partial [Candidatus Aenigmatarchaeota archaeon]
YMAEVDYDSGQDILYLYKKGEKAKFSVEVLENFVIDVADNKIVGLEIFNASKVLDVNKTDLKNIKKAELSTLIIGKMYGVAYALQLEKFNLESRLQIPVRI